MAIVRERTRSQTGHSQGPTDWAVICERLSLQAVQAHVEGVLEAEPEITPLAHGVRLEFIRDVGGARRVIEQEVLGKDAAETSVIQLASVCPPAFRSRPTPGYGPPEHTINRLMV